MNLIEAWKKAKPNKAKLRSTEGWWIYTDKHTTLKNTIIEAGIPDEALFEDWNIVIEKKKVVYFGVEFVDWRDGKPILQSCSSIVPKNIPNMKMTLEWEE